MMYYLLFSLSILVAPASACEGECIVTLQAFVGNYSNLVQHVFAEATVNLARDILPSQSTVTAGKLMEPLLDAYERGAYDAMEKAIFPSYFHGKCQVNGVDPAGCPNPDCPVVCGTPGSLVHFYNVLKDIAFNITASNLVDLCAPSSPTYQTLEKAVLHELRKRSRSRRSVRSTYSLSRLAPYRIARRSTHTGFAPDRSLQKRKVFSEAQAKAALSLVCRSTANDLAKQCGGKASLSNCSWEQEMKAFILSFP